MTKAESIKRFEKAVVKKFGKGTYFSYRDADPDEEIVEGIEVSVPIDNIDWANVSPGVEAALKSSGASRYFAIGGSGLGFGYRDVSIYRK
jgi:hypothetical protein